MGALSIFSSDSIQPPKTNQFEVTTPIIYANTSAKQAPNISIEKKSFNNPVDQKKVFYANQLIWLDPYSQKQQEQQMKQLQESFIVKKLNTVQQCLTYIRERFMITEIPLVCAGSLFSSLEEEFETHREEAAKIKYIYIFCMDLEKYEPLKTHNKVVCVENNLQILIETIKANVVGLQLPNFRNFADNEDKTKQIKYSYFLTFLTNPIKESQRKQLIVQCINTLNEVQQVSLSIKIYPVDHKSMLQLYSNVVIFNFVNKILKSNSLELIGKAHILIHDLNQAIKQFSALQFRQKIPSVLFRGTQLFENQIASLIENIGSSVQLLGFLSTSKSYEVAKQDFRKNVLIKIYIPSFFREEKSKNMKIRGGYVDFGNNIEAKFNTQQQVLFSIKSLFSVLRVLSKVEEGKKMFTVEMLYGTVQLLLYLSENKKQFSFQVHNNLLRSVKMKCKNCNSTVHLIGTSSKKRFCLKDFPPSALQKESFILENANKTVTGMPLEYDELTLKHFENPEGKSESLLCKKCQSKVRCSGCFNGFCLCSLENHDKEHLDKCYIMVEGELPRFMMLELNERELNLFENHQELESKITCRADAFLLMKDEHTLEKAWSLYSERINHSDFESLDYNIKYHYYENRAQSYRLRKYVNEQVRSKLTIQGYQLCLKDYIKCFELAKDKQDQALRQSKAMMGMGIIQDDIAQVLQAKETKDKIPLLGSRKIFKDALRDYQQAQNILAQLKKMRPLTNKESLHDIQIKNCVAFIYWHTHQFVAAISRYEEIINLIEKLEMPIKRDLAKYLNNLTCCINLYVESLNWSDLHLIKKHLDKAVVYGKRSYQLRLCLFGAGYQLTKNSKYTFGRAQEYLKECEQRLSKQSGEKDV